MSLHEFIYTTHKMGRYYRHIAFWLTRYLFLLSAMEMNGYLFYDVPPVNLAGILVQTFFSVILEAVYTYGLVYYAVPKYLQQKQYLKFSAFFLISTFLVLIILIKLGYYGDSVPGHSGFSLLTLWAVFWGYAGYGPPAVFALFMVIKAVKLHNKKMEEKSALIRENARAESQFLKAQIHPHFLFNTLNNIYSYALVNSKYATRLIDNLSAIMRYMIKDCEAPLVPLENELKIIYDYIELEKVRYDKRLATYVIIEGETAGKMIDPLLIIPLIENCFKHGASQTRQKTWIRVRIFIENAVIRVEVCNRKPPGTFQANKKGIGLNNIRKRLELLHPENHLLKIQSLTSVFKVYMQVPLSQATP